MLSSLDVLDVPKHLEHRLGLLDTLDVLKPIEPLKQSRMRCSVLAPYDTSCPHRAVIFRMKGRAAEYYEFIENKIR